MKINIGEGGRRSHGRMVVGCTTRDAISAYQLSSLKCELESCSWRGVLDTINM